MIERTIATLGADSRDATVFPEEALSSGTRALLTAGVIAGPLYVTTSLTQALTREGFDTSKHPWSTLANGHLGWIQSTNLVVTGILVTAFSVGLRRTLRTGRGRTWVPRLITVFGLGMVLPGFFRADPALGFPPGTPADYRVMSWHGTLHMVFASIGFVCVIAACLIMARRYLARGDRGLAAWSAVTGVFFIAGEVGLASTGSGFWIYAFTAAVILVFVWLGALAVRVLRDAIA